MSDTEDTKPEPVPALVCSFCKRPQAQPRCLDDATLEQIKTDSGVVYEASTEEGCPAICPHCVREFWMNNAMVAGFVMGPLHTDAFPYRMSYIQKRAVRLKVAPFVREHAQDLLAEAVELILLAESMLDEARVFPATESVVEDDAADG